MATKELYWKVHTSDLFKEIVTGNANNAIFRQPLTITKDILREIAERVAELNDPKLKLLCCRLALYSIADPTSKEYNPDIFKILEKQIEQPPSEAPPSSSDAERRIKAIDEQIVKEEARHRKKMEELDYFKVLNYGAVAKAGLFGGKVPLLHCGTWGAILYDS